MPSAVPDYRNGIDILVESTKRPARAPAPVSCGIPFPKGYLSDGAPLALHCSCGGAMPLQTQSLSHWPDGSCKWVLVDFIAGDSSKYRLTATADARSVSVQNAVAVSLEGGTAVMRNGLLTYTARVGDAFGTLEDESGSRARVFSSVHIGSPGSIATSSASIERIEAYARGPIRAALALYGTRTYSDGAVGPFSQRVEMYADCGWLKVDDTFVYAHIPGTRGAPRNPLALWQIEKAQLAGRFDMLPFIDQEEAEGLVAGPDAVAFWGLDTPYDLTRHTDDDLAGEDCPGIALGVAKSCAALIGRDAGRGVRPHVETFARTTPAVYAGSTALGHFAAQSPGEFERAENGLEQGLLFFLWHQDNDPAGYMSRGPWHGLFDWGDFQTRYTEPLHSQPVAWQYYGGRYGWDCGEMDTCFMLWTAFLHTGRKSYWRSAVAMSRHAMDVDMINVDYRKYGVPEYVYDPHSYGAPWKEGYDRLRDIDTTGLGRRHNVQHWGNGVGDTRHTFNSGAAMYYLLTGNRRALDAVRAMADMHMQRIFGHASGEYALSLECIYWAYRVTGEERYMDEFNYRLDALLKLRLPRGTLPEALDFNAMHAYPELDPEGRGSCYASLSLDYISNALADFHFDTGDERAADILLGLAGAVMATDQRIGDLNYPEVPALRILAWAYLHTRDEQYLPYLEFLVSTLSADPMPKQPETADEVFRFTYGIQKPQHWRIRHIGPGLRMLPYALASLEP